ncbi:hypothetical protein BH20ACT15_BH20ACT15_08110 [soil metagenome]
MSTANDVQIERTGATAKVRSPWLVLLLTVITLGVYSAFWWYFINRELKDLGASRKTKSLGTEPALSTLAYTLGGLVYIPYIWTIVTTSKRVQEAQRQTVGKTMNGWIAAALWIFGLLLGGIVYTQFELNKVWRAPGMRPVVPADEAGLAAGDAERLQKLEELRDRGALTDLEHAAERERLGVRGNY